MPQNYGCAGGKSENARLLFGQLEVDFRRLLSWPWTGCLLYPMKHVRTQQKQPNQRRERATFLEITLMKKRKLAGHKTGPDFECTCRCMERLSQDEKDDVTMSFNRYDSKDAHDAYLSSLVQPKKEARHRPRKHPKAIKLHEYSYSYQVRLLRSSMMETLPLCHKAFCLSLASPTDGCKP